jgi:hypothetical protein
MCGIKIWKGNENPRSVYKKPFFEILSGFLPFFTFSVLKKGHCPFEEMETFFSLNRSNGASKTPSFRTDFKNGHMTLVKSAHKKLSPKTILLIKNRFCGQKFFWVQFLLRSYVHFCNQYEKTVYDTPFDLIKEKN